MEIQGKLCTAGEACRTLSLPASTLRAYSARLAPILSPWAGRPPVLEEGRFRRRMYTQRDLAILAGAKDLLDKGLTFQQVLEQLGEQRPGRRDQEATTSRPSHQDVQAPRQLSTLVETAQASIRLAQEAVAQWRAIAQEREKELIRLQGILEERERAIASLGNALEVAKSQIQELRTRVDELEGKKRWPFRR